MDATKFKVGDKVEDTGSPFQTLNNAPVGTVTSVTVLTREDVVKELDDAKSEVFNVPVDPDVFLQQQAPGAEWPYVLVTVEGINQYGPILVFPTELALVESGAE